jgi:hypothetical protein
MDSLEKRIVKEINNMLKEEEGTPLLISFRDYFVQLKASQNKTKLLFLAVSNAHLLEGDRLTDDKLTQMIQLGLEIDPNIKDYVMDFQINEAELERSAHITSEVMKLYGANLNRLEYEIDSDD